MSAVSRPQLLVYALLALVVALLGARAVRADRQAEAPPPAAVVEAADGSSLATDAGATTPAAPPTSSGDTTPGTTTPRSESEPRSASPDRAREAGLLVHVAGAVRRPGVYLLAPDARVEDAVTMAGGARRGADVHALNLAAKVADGQQITIPRRGRPASSAAGAPGSGAAGPAGAGASGSGDAGGGGAAAGAAAPGAAAPGGGPSTAAGGIVDLNTATIEQLETLDGVGPAIAQKIVAWREGNGGFRSVDDLAQVSGIGPKKLEAMRPRVRV